MTLLVGVGTGLVVVVALGMVGLHRRRVRQLMRQLAAAADDLDAALAEQAAANRAAAQAERDLQSAGDAIGKQLDARIAKVVRSHPLSALMSLAKRFWASNRDVPAEPESLLRELRAMGAGSEAGASPASPGTTAAGITAELRSIATESMARLAALQQDVAAELTRAQVRQSEAAAAVAACDAELAVCMRAATGLRSLRSRAPAETAALSAAQAPGASARDRMLANLALAHALAQRGAPAASAAARRGDGVVMAHRGIALYEAAVFAAAGLLCGFWALPFVLNAAGGSPDMADSVGLLLWGVPCLLLIAAVVRALTQRLTVSDGGLQVRNILSTHTVAWTEVSGFSTDATHSSATTWWSVQVLLRESDRIVNIQASYSFTPDKAEAFARRLRRLAPRGTALDDHLGARIPSRPDVGLSSGTGQRYVARSWAYPGGYPPLSLLMGWIPVAFLAGLVGVGLIGDKLAAVGAAVLAAVCLLTVLVARWGRPRLLVTAGGLRPGRWPWTRTIPWIDIGRLSVIETANQLMTKRCGLLVVHLGAGNQRLLWATRRPISQIEAVYAKVIAFAPPNAAG